jgi:Membrane bound beta barrel domain (DUF5777)
MLVCTSPDRAATSRAAWMITGLAWLFALALPVFAAAQASTGNGPAMVVKTDQPDPDLRLVPSEPDFTLGALPTTLRMPTGKVAFRLTHRFARPIGAGSVGDCVSDFFGLDSAAHVGLEVRYGLLPGTEVTFHRTNDRTIQLLGQREIAAPSDTWPLTVDALVAVEGRNNLRTMYATTLGAVVSRRIADHTAAIGSSGSISRGSSSRHGREARSGGGEVVRCSAQSGDRRRSGVGADPGTTWRFAGCSLPSLAPSRT